MFQKTKINLAITVACGAGFAVTGVNPAFAQDAEPAQMTITGSYLKRTETETAAPVQTITRSDIQQLGANTLRQILNTVTAFDSGTLTDNGNRSSFASGASAASMRGLGKQASLVLLNGRRVSNYALTDGAKEQFVNLDSFPADAIERIEILKDGASALYGSEAMAGVINIITRQNFEGGLVSGAYQQTTEGLSAQRTASLTLGKGNYKSDGFNAFGTIESYQRKGYFLADVLDLYPEYTRKSISPSLGAPSTVSSPGNIYTNPLGSTARVANPKCQTKNSAGLCVSDLNSTLDQRSDPAERINFFGGLRFKINNQLELFGEASYSDTRTTYLNTGLGINNPATPHLWYDGGAKQLIQLSKPLLPVTHPLNTYGKPIGIEYRFMDPQINYQEPSDASQYRVMAGLRGDIGDKWSWEAVLARYGADATKSGWFLDRNYGSVISSGEYVIGGPNTQATLDKFIKRGAVNANTSTTYIDARLTGEAGKLPAGPVKVAVGAERRAESTFIQSSENIMKAELVGRGAQEAIGDRTLSAAYVEAEAPIAKGLFVNGALRYDAASGFDSRISPKVSMRFQATDKLMLRGTAGGGFRTPNVAETLARVGVTGFFNSTYDPKRCETAQKIRDALNTGNATDKLDATAAYNSGCLASVPAMIGANPNLAPETSKNMTIGFVFEPVRNVSIAADYFNITRKNEIDYRSIDYVLDREDALYSKQISRLPVDATDLSWAARANQLAGNGSNLSWNAGKLSSVILAYENMGRTQTSGIDIDARARMKLENADLTLQFMATRLIKYLNWDVDAQAWEPNYAGTYGQPKWVRNIAASYRTPSWTFGGRISYTGSTSINGLPYGSDLANWGADGKGCKTFVANPNNAAYKDYPCRINSTTTIQLSAAYTAIKNTRISATMFNVLDETSPVDIRRGTGPSFQSLRLSVDHRF